MEGHNLAGIAEKIRGHGRGVKLRDTRSAVKALTGLGYPIESIEIEIRPGSCATVRVKQNAERQEPKANEWDEAIAKTAVPVR
jgi:hypothetical protein